jgi:hypothetical protein
MICAIFAYIKIKDIDVIFLDFNQGQIKKNLLINKK